MIVNAILQSYLLKSLDNHVIFQDELHQNNKTYLIFEDLLHFLKCFRYRLCSRCGITPSVYTDENNNINGPNFETAGIPSWLTDNSKYLKMDDRMLLCLFTYDNIEKFIVSGRMDLAYSRLPCTLLNDATMKTDIDRSTRIEIISLYYSIVFLYFCEL